VTVYPPHRESKSALLPGLGEQLRGLFSRGLQDPARAASAVAEVGTADDTALNTLTKSLLAWETMLGRAEGGAPAPVFRLDPTYESALVRFGVLSLILAKVSTPLAAGSLVLYLFLTAVILATAIAHRRRQYGLLLMSGIKPSDVGYIVGLQIVLSCIVGGLAGYSVFQATAFVVNMLLAESAIVANARMIIGLDVPSFLPSIDWLTVVALWLGMTFLAVLVGKLVLRLQGITSAQAPIDLVKS